MLRRVKTSYKAKKNQNSRILEKKQKLKASMEIWASKLEKKRTKKLNFSENNNPNNTNDQLQVVTGIKNDSWGYKRQKTWEEDATVSTAASFTSEPCSKIRKSLKPKPVTSEKREKLKPSKPILETPLKIAFKVEKSDKRRYFNLFNEKDLKWTRVVSHTLIDNEEDDDCQTDQEALENSVNYNLRQIETLEDILKIRKSKFWTKYQPSFDLKESISSVFRNLWKFVNKFK